MIKYNRSTNTDVVICALDTIDSCIPSSRQLIKNVSDQTLLKLSEKFCILVSKNLDEMLADARLNFKIAIIVPTGIDLVELSAIDIPDTVESFTIINLLDRVDKFSSTTFSKESLASKIFYLDGSTEYNFNQSLAWQNKKFTIGQSNLFYPINNEIVHDVTLPIIHQLVTPAAGLNWVEYLNQYGYDNTTVVRFYDYSYFALDCMKEVLQWDGVDYPTFIKELGHQKFNFIGKDWDWGFASLYKEPVFDNWKDIIKTVKFEFVLINLLEDFDITHLVSPLPNTFVNLSNIFTYYLTSCHYSLQDRMFAEQRVLDHLKSYDCYVGLLTRAADIYSPEIKLSGHISEFAPIDNLNLPTWHD
jgi:hypothetical protein